MIEIAVETVQRLMLQIDARHLEAERLQGYLDSVIPHRLEQIRAELDILEQAAAICNGPPPNDELLGELGDDMTRIIQIDAVAPAADPILRQPDAAPPTEAETVIEQEIETETDIGSDEELEDGPQDDLRRTIAAAVTAATQPTPPATVARLVLPERPDGRRGGWSRKPRPGPYSVFWRGVLEHLSEQESFTSETFVKAALQVDPSIPETTLKGRLNEYLKLKIITKVTRYLYRLRPNYKNFMPPEEPGQSSDRRAALG